MLNDLKKSEITQLSFVILKFCQKIMQTLLSVSEWLCL